MWGCVCVCVCCWKLSTPIKSIIFSGNVKTSVIMAHTPADYGTLVPYNIPNDITVLFWNILAAYYYWFLSKVKQRFMATLDSCRRKTILAQNYETTTMTEMNEQTMEMMKLMGKKYGNDNGRTNEQQCLPRFCKSGSDYVSHYLQIWFKQQHHWIFAEEESGETKTTMVNVGHYRRPHGVLYIYHFF